MREQASKLKNQVIYYSKSMANIEVMLEVFFLNMMQEKAEPLIACLELIKALMKLKEYRQLIKKEKIRTYLEHDTYTDYRRERDEKTLNIKLERSGKSISKLKDFHFSADLQRLQGKKKQSDMEIAQGAAE